MRGSCPPIFNGSVPSLRNILHGQVHEFEDSAFIVEHRFRLDHLTQRAIEGFNGIGGVDHFANRHGVVKDGNDSLPVSHPDLADSGILLIPLVREGLQGHFSFF